MRGWNNKSEKRRIVGDGGKFKYMWHKPSLLGGAEVEEL